MGRYERQAALESPDTTCRTHVQHHQSQCQENPTRNNEKPGIVTIFRVSHYVRISVLVESLRKNFVKCTIAENCITCRKLFFIRKTLWLGSIGFSASYPRENARKDNNKTIVIIDTTAPFSSSSALCVAAINLRVFEHCPTKTDLHATSVSGPLSLWWKVDWFSFAARNTCLLTSLSGPNMSRQRDQTIVWRKPL